MEKKLTIFIILCSFVASSFAQISVPVTDKDLSDYNRERQTIEMMNIDLSQTWLYMAKDNLMSSNKILVSEVVYNKNGSPEKMFFYDENQKIKNFTVIKYNNQNLPFEEIRFNTDSTLLNGIMYTYDKNNLLQQQINYSNDGKIVSSQSYNRSNDTIYVGVFNGKKEIISRNIITLEEKNSFDYIKNLVKIDESNRVIEQVVFEYDEMAELTKKFIVDEKNHAKMKDFVYNEDGALIKSSFYDTQSKLISSSSYEYDLYGNISRIIENTASDNSTKVFEIKYLSRTKEN